MEGCGPLCIMYILLQHYIIHSTLEHYIHMYIYTLQCYIHMYIYTLQHYIHTLQYYNAALHTYIHCGGKSVVMRNASYESACGSITILRAHRRSALVAFEDWHCFFSRFFSHSPTQFYTLDEEYHFHTH